MSCTILKLWRMMVNSESVTININEHLLELLLLGNLIWMVFLIKNSNLLNFPMSLLATSNLAYWLVSSATIWPLTLFPKSKPSFYNMSSFFFFLKILLASLMRWSFAMFHQEVQGLFLNSMTWGYVVQFTLLLSIFNDY